MNSVIDDTIAKLPRSDRGRISYVDVYNAFDGHEACQYPDAWMNDVVETVPYLSVNDLKLEINHNGSLEYSFHPNRDGHAKFAELVKAAIAGTTSSTQTIHRGQTIGQKVTVGVRKALLRVSSLWPGSDVVTTLVSPSGRVIDRDTVAADVTHTVTGTSESYLITDPEPGEWTVNSYGADVDEAGEPLTVSVLTRLAANQPPVARGSASATAVVAGVPVSFDASASSDSDGTVEGYVWDFGDGRTATSVNPSHRYTAAGTFTPTLAVLDDRGGRALVSLPTITVTAPPTPVAGDQFLGTPANAALPVHLTGVVAGDASLTFSVVAQPAHGTLSGSGADLIYTPNPDYLGQDVFTFTASANGQTSPQGTVTIQVVPAQASVATTTTLAGNPNPSTYGQWVTFTATVTAPGLTPSGTVTFSDGDTPLPGCTDVPLNAANANTATCTTNRLTAGLHPITAAYRGGPALTPSQATLNQTVTPAVLTIDAHNATTTYGGPAPSLGYELSGFVNGELPNIASGAADCRLTQQANAGTYPNAITCSQGTLSAPNYTFAPGRAGTLTITPAPLTITADDQRMVYGDPLPALTAHLSGFVAGETLATSGVTGTALCTTTGTRQSPAGSYPITCTEGTLAARNYAFADFRAGTLTVVKRAATVGYTGTLFVSTGSATATSAPTVTLQAQLTPAAGGTPDLTQATVEFLLYKNTNLTMNPATPDLRCTTTATATGAANCVLRDVPADNWTVIATIPASNGFFGPSAADPVVLTVYQPIPGKFATAGGWVTDPSYQNKPVPIAPGNDHGHFGFHVRYKSGTTPTGQAVYTFRGADGYRYVIKTNSWQGGGLSFGTNTVSFSAKCIVTVLDPATGGQVPGLGGGNFTCRIDATDNGEPGTTDTYALSVYTSAGALYHQVGTTQNPTPLRGGNVLIHTR